MILCMTTCKRDVPSCNCERIDVYGPFAEGLLFPIRINEEDIRGYGMTHQISDSSKIESIKKVIVNLELLKEDFEGIDVRVVVDLICKNGGKSTMLMNHYILQIENNYYKTNEELLDLISKN